jgi:hypothetical protein
MTLVTASQLRLVQRLSRAFAASYNNPVSYNRNIKYMMLLEYMAPLLYGRGLCKQAVKPVSLNTGPCKLRFFYLWRIWKERRANSLAIGIYMSVHKIFPSCVVQCAE